MAGKLGGDAVEVNDDPAKLDLVIGPADVSAAARDYAPHRLTRFAMELAGLMNVFYENCRVLPSKEDPIPTELSTARLALVNAARIVLRNLLTLTGISAPDRM